MDSPAYIQLDRATRVYREGGLLGAMLRGAAHGKTALKSVSLELRPGDVLGIVGESGGGKSTLARLMAGLDDPDEGRVLWMGRDLASMRGRERHAFRRGHVQILLQNQYGSLNPRMRVLDIVAESVRCHMGRRGRAAREAAAGLLERARVLGCAEELPVRLSGGERRAVTIACALAASPRVLLLDEPVAGLDPRFQCYLLGLLEQLVLANPKLAIALISHELGVVLQIAHRVIVLLQGQVVEEFAVVPGELDLRQPYTRELFSADRAARLRGPGAAPRP